MLGKPSPFFGPETRRLGATLNPAQPPGRLAGLLAAAPLPPAGDRAGALGAARGWDLVAGRAAAGRLVLARGALADGAREGVERGADRVVGLERGADRVVGLERGADRVIGADRLGVARLGVALGAVLPLGATRSAGARAGWLRLGVVRVDGVTRELGARLGETCGAVRPLPDRATPSLLGAIDPDVVRVGVAAPAARSDPGTLRGKAAEGRLAPPPRVVRSTETGVRPTVGTRVALSDGRVARLGAVPVGLTLGARRFTDAVPVGRFATASATLARGATAVGRRCAVRVVDPRGLSL